MEKEIGNTKIELYILQNDRLFSLKLRYNY
jgi:hypothetical protein